MGRIADNAVAFLATGPAHVRDLGEALANRGITRARDPAAAVRGALRDDPRVAELDDGRLVSLGQALDGVELAVLVTPDAERAGELEVEPDLAPFGMAGLGPMLPLPEGCRAGETLVVRLEVGQGRTIVERRGRPLARPLDEAALGEAVRARLGVGRNAETPWAFPPAILLASTALAVMAVGPDAFRQAGRPLTEVLADQGFEVHLGWIAVAGAAWEHLTEVEVDALSDEVSDLMSTERFADATLVQERLVRLMRRHLPDGAPEATRRLAAILTRAGRSRDALAALRSQLHLRAAEDRYEIALVAIGLGELPLARRMVQEGLALGGDDPDPGVAASLEDLAGDLDAQADFARLHDRLARSGPLDELPLRVARAIVGPRRSYLVEAMIEALFAELDEDGAVTLIEALGEDAGEIGREACLAASACLPEPVAAVARRVAGGAQAALPTVTGLLEARPVAAWATAPQDAVDQQQVVIAVGKEEGRVSPLVVLLDFEDMGGAVKDAFFLPDMARARLDREVFSRMAEIGLPPWQVRLPDALDALGRGLEITRRLGWRLPSLATQPVLSRIERRVLSLQSGA